MESLRLSSELKRGAGAETARLCIQREGDGVVWARLLKSPIYICIGSVPEKLKSPIYTGSHAAYYVFIIAFGDVLLNYCSLHRLFS